MLRDTIHHIQDAILRRPAAVLAGSLVLALVAALLGTRVEFRKSRSELAPPDDPDQRRWSALLEQYRGSEALIACVEGENGDGADPAALRRFTDRLAAALAEDPRVEQAFHRFDPARLGDRLLWLAPPEALERAAAAWAAERSWLSAALGSRGLAELDARLAERLERDLAGTGAAPGPGAETGASLGPLVRALAEQRRFLEDPGVTLDGLPAGDDVADGWAALLTLGADGYLATRDGETLFVLLTPVSSGDGVREHRAWIASARNRAEELGERWPGYRVGFTGQPALVVEEMDQVRRDTWLTSLIAVVGVSMLTLFVFRWRSHALLVLAALGLGILWSFGAVWLEYGYLNLITSSFISTLIGIGVAYGIHPVSEYELEGAHLADPTSTVRRAFRRTAAAVAVAALTTSAAFFSIQLMRFRGFGELGLVAGVGVVLCLLASMVSLPAMLVLYGRRRHRRERGRRDRAAPVVDRFWVERVAGRVCRRPRVVVAAAALITLASGWAAAGLRFDIDILALLPRDAESLRLQNRMIRDSDLSPLFALVVAGDLADLRDLERRAAAEPTIERFESVTRFLPAEPERSARSLAELASALSEVRPIPDPAPVDPAALEAALSRLEEALVLAADGAFTAGLTELAGPLEEARAEVERSVAVVRGAGPERVVEWTRGQERLWRLARASLDGLRRAAASPPPDLDGLPPEIRRRYFTADGRPLAFLHPSGRIFDRRFLDEYVAAVRRVSPDATGFPIVFHKMAGRITQGFYRAVAVGGLLVTLLLLLDYRTWREPLLALTPLAMGVLWMMGGMRLLGITFNFANLVAVPLIIGVGIDNGVHVIHRVRLEGRSGISVVLRHTGRAILIASLTTMIGFGSLALASHRGLASLGLVLLLGVGSCLLTSTIVLPNLLLVLGFCPPGDDSERRVTEAADGRME